MAEALRPSALFARKAFRLTRRRRWAGMVALLALAMPWAALTVHSVPDGTAGAMVLGYRTGGGLLTPEPAIGASTLFGVASGLGYLGHAGLAAAGSGLVLLVMVVLLAGALLSLVHVLGGPLSVGGAALYAGAVNGPLAAAGEGLPAHVEVGFGIGFWVFLLAAALSTAGTCLWLYRLTGPAKRDDDAIGATGPETAAAVQAATPGAAPHDVLSIRGLTVRFYTYDGVLKALDGVSFTVREREILGIVGETGCGKSVTAKAILRLIPDPPGRITGGEVVFEGINLLDSIEQEARIKVGRSGRARIRRNRKIAKRMEALMRTIRGSEISMIFQEPTAALNPVITIGDQIGETFLTHQIGEMCDAVAATRRLSALQRWYYGRLKRKEKLMEELEEVHRWLSVKRAVQKAAREAGDVGTEAAARDDVGQLERTAFAKAFKLLWVERGVARWRRVPFLGKDHLMAPLQEEADRRVVEMLKQVNIPDPASKANAYPFELSGGMQQRAMIAMALACRPRLLLADEPTTALDVTIQAQVLSLIRGLRDQFGSSIILITHDLGVVAETCERVGVMYAGVMAEIGSASDVFSGAKHPYTVGLLRSIPETYARTGKLSIIPGSVPSLLNPPTGCRFHPRCAFASESCKQVIPQLFEVAPGHAVACHLYDHPEYFPKGAIAARDAGLPPAALEVKAA